MKSKLSVILATPDNFQTIATTIGYLAQQSCKEVIEIVIVAPSKDLEVDDAKLAVFAHYQIVATDITTIGRANATGIRHAKSPIVALAEDHCFPAPDWAEHLIKRHEQPWAVVGPAVSNANPRSIVSWADFFIGYGPWLQPISSQEMTFLPGHNSSYKKDILLEYGSKLDEMMEAETVLHWDLHHQGHRLYLEAAAKTAHTNFSLWSSWLPLQYHNGRLFAGTRIQTMTTSKRFVYIVGSPLIPAVRLLRTVRTTRSAKLLRKLVCCFPALLIGLSLDGLGQMAGYLWGIGNSSQKVREYEFHRKNHITKKDREELFANLYAG